MNEYEREGRLFRLLLETIEEEQKTAQTDGVEDLMSVLRVHVKNLDRLAVGRQPDYPEYLELLDAIVMSCELIEALLANHADDMKAETSQASRMCALLVDVRADLEKNAWEFEDRMPKLRSMFSEARAEKFIH